MDSRIGRKRLRHLDAVVALSAIWLLAWIAKKRGGHLDERQS